MAKSNLSNQSEIIQRQRILVVDDEPGITFLIQTKLENAGFDVLTANDGGHALDVIRQFGLPHLAIVDIIMPEMNGFEFCAAVHEFSDLPIIMLSSVDDEDTIVHSIEGHAEDYITKPFRPRELLARVKKVLKRIGDYSYILEMLIPIDNRLAVDIANQRLVVDGKSLSMTPTEAKLLHLLIRQTGEILSGEFLQERLWPQGAVDEGALRINIFRLRKKIESDPTNPTYLITHRGKGYQFIK
ncbi:MAG: response regulator transcription factor [Anaerolineales bacterium]|nr:response regulator transcription factor [Anaerolineales bacterium]